MFLFLSLSFFEVLYLSATQKPNNKTLERQYNISPPLLTRLCNEKKQEKFKQDIASEIIMQICTLYYTLQKEK